MRRASGADQTLPATGSVIREGAGKAYVGSCPPSGMETRSLWRVDKARGGKQ